MGEAQAQPSAIAWFTDPRTSTRRMKAAWHPEAGVVVFSLWAADHCTATFRLPIDRAPELMHLLVDALAGERSVPQPEPTFVSLRDRLRKILRVGSRRTVASITPIRRTQ